VIAYITRRLLLLIPIWFGVLTLVFLMRALVPGDPVDIMFFGQQSDPVVKQAVRHQLGLDRPLYVQYGKYVWGAVHGDLGTAITTQRPVVTEIKSRYPNTLVLTFASLTVAIIIGFAAGILGAVYKDSPIDTASTVLSLVGLSMPGFWLGLLLIYIFAVNLHWFPVLGSMSPRGMILPSVTLGFIASAVLARIVRSSMLEVLNEDYIRTARAKGLKENRVVWKHGVRSAITPVVTIFGLDVGALLGGAVITETVFDIPGIGRLNYDAIIHSDFPIVQGTVILAAMFIVVANIVVDITYAYLDPRVRYS
jgi:peptide/nickel transport system permease protein